MEKVFHSSRRKWISRLTNLGDCMEEVKRLVRLRNESVFVVDPNDEACNVGFQDGYSRAEDSFSQDDEARDYMRPDARTVNTEDLTEDNLETARDDDMSPENKWQVSDDICKGAVDCVRGSKFFTIKKKKKKKRKEGKNVSAPESDPDDDIETEIKNQRRKLQSQSSLSEPKAGTSADGVSNISSQTYPSSSMQIVLKEEPDSEFSIKFPDMASVLLEPNELENLKLEDHEWDHLDLDNDFDNFANNADRYEAYKQCYPELLNSDSESSNKENESSEDDIEEEENIDAETETFLPVTRSSTAKKTGKPTSGTVKRRRKMNNATTNRQNEPIPGSSRHDMAQNKENMQETNDQGNSNQANENTEKPRGLGNNETEEDESAIDFKRFSNWVFDRTKHRNAVSKRSDRCHLKREMNLSGDTVNRYQETTSSSLATVKGEVFQDEQVLKFSSMPVLAPQIVTPSGVNLQSLAIFISHGDEPSIFPWKSMNVQQQMNDDFNNDEFLTRLEQQQKDLLNPALKDELVDKENDFVVHVLIYQATDPEDAKLPDEAKIDGLHDEYSGNVPFTSLFSSRWFGFGITKDSGEGMMGRFLQVVSKSPYHPLLAIFGFGDAETKKAMNSEPKLAYEVRILGSQSIKDLVNAIQCENDYLYLENISHPDNYIHKPENYAKARFQSKMIMIHDTIYNNPEGNEDYASTVNEWIHKKPNKQIGPFKTGDWNTKLKDLNLKFGFPYVYIHLGGCEHIISFSKARLLHMEDHHLKKDYPKINGISKFRNVYCRVDNEYLARWAVVDFKEFPENPMLLCNDCVLMYCYDRQKKKRGDFRLYPFTQMANIA